MKVNKYSTDKNQSNLKSKLRSYGTMAAAFMVAGGAYAQCGTADSANPVLDIDIDGDGTTDVTLNFNTALFGGSNTSTVPIAASTNLVSTQVGTLSASFYVGPNFSFYGCQFAYVPAYFGYGFFSVYFNADPAWGAYTTVNATEPVNLQVNALDVFQYYFNYIAGTAYNASAVAAGSNQIVGLTAAGSSVCGAIDSAPGVSGPNNVSLGSAGNTYSYNFSVLAANSVQYLYVAGSTCLTASYATFGYYAPPVPVLATSASYLYVGPFALATPAISTATGTFQNTNATTHLAVQFIAGGETHNGWVEISIDPATSAITCVGTGYQQCSIETAIANSGDASNACINTGEATNESIACTVSDIPTVGEWGLIILGLMMSITAIVGIRQRREEEATA